eukprot:2553299-Alexandrium_andersonii.AAC.1
MASRLTGPDLPCRPGQVRGVEESVKGRRKGPRIWQLAGGFQRHEMLITEGQHKGWMFGRLQTSFPGFWLDGASKAPFAAGAVDDGQTPAQHLGHDEKLEPVDPLVGSAERPDVLLPITRNRAVFRNHGGRG